jgi:hypothetical protein
VIKVVGGGEEGGDGGIHGGLGSVESAAAERKRMGETRGG